MSGRIGLLAGMAAVILLVVAATVAAAFDGRVARAWLIVFAAGSAAPVGATVLLLVGRLTGGHWTQAWRPVLVPLACATPLAAFAFLPVVANLAAVYPWAASAGAAPPDVARLYLNVPFFLGRAAIALGGWSVLGLAVGLGRPPRLLAGLGLAFHGIAVSLVSIDWFLSVEPGTVSSSFGATVAIVQLATALALVALIGLQQEARPDCGALLLATVIGIVYLDLMAFAIAWYGDLPDTIGWYVQRGEGPWLPCLLAALAGAVLAAAILLREAGRRGTELRWAGGLALGALAFHWLCLIGPALGEDAATAAALVLAAAGIVLAANAIRHGREGAAAAASTHAG